MSCFGDTPGSSFANHVNIWTGMDPNAELSKAKVNPRAQAHLKVTYRYKDIYKHTL